MRKGTLAKKKKKSTEFILENYLYGGERVRPEGRVDGPVVPGGEEGCPHVVDQVNNFYLQQSSQLLWR